MGRGGLGYLCSRLGRIFARFLAERKAARPASGAMDPWGSAIRMSGNARDWRRAAPTVIGGVTRGAAFAAVPLVAAFALSACTTGNTYGTGTSPGLQTLKDISGIAMITGEHQAPIDYEPRPNLVAPPSTADLPPPGTGDDTDTAANWPKDPDVTSAKAKAAAAAASASGQEPNQYYVASASAPSASTAGSTGADLTPDQLAAARKAFAAAKGGVSVDANGNPVRKYLTDPPVDYRQPDPTQPLTADNQQKKRKKFLWWYIDE